MRRVIWKLLLISLILSFFSINAGSEHREQASELDGRALSLRVLQQTLESLSPGESLSDEITNLGGMKRPCGYVIDTATHDVILVGCSSPSAPSLHLDDLIIALRNAWWEYAETKGNTQYYSYPGCSIDPDPKTFQMLQQLANEILSTTTIEEVEEKLEKWDDLCERPQKVRVMGVPFDSRFAQVMVKADYDMKTIVDGSDDSLNIPGFKSLVDMTLDKIKPAVIQGKPITIPLFTLNRFWFYPGENVYLAGDLAAVIDECPVMLLSEEEYLHRSGGRVGSGRANPLAQEFCESFSDHYGELAEQRPIYAELENLYRLVAVAMLMHDRNATVKAGLDLDYLLNEYPVAESKVDRTLDGRSHVKEFMHREDFDGGYSELHLWLPSCGGVGIEINPKKAEYKKGPQVIKELDSITKRVFETRPGANALNWNFHRKFKCELDEWEQLLQIYAAMLSNSIGIDDDLISMRKPLN
jgi:hypothetical protein